MKKFQIAPMLLLLCCFCADLTAQQPAGGNSKQAQPAGKHVPEAKTRAEFDDYKKAYAVSGGAAAEKAAEDFSAKYPNSELRAILYSHALHEYQTENNQAKILAMGEKYLQFEPDNPVALVLTANALLDGLGDGDKDRDKKITKIKEYSSRALQTIDVNYAPAPETTAEQVAAYKKTLKSSAHGTLGIVALRSGDDAEAETELKAATELDASQADFVLWFDLALAQDHQKKYADALVSINKAAQFAGSDPELATRVQGEQERLRILNHEAPEAPPQPGPVPK